MSLFVTFWPYISNHWIESKATINTNIQDLRTIGFSASLVVLSILFLLMANRAKKLHKIMLLLVLSQSLLILVNIVHIESNITNQISKILILYGSLFAGIGLLINCGTGTLVNKNNQNKLTGWGTYLAVLLFLLIGLPGTYSFSAWFQLIAHFTEAPLLLVLILFSNIMLTVVVLHTLQDYVFNLKNTHQLSKAVTPQSHAILAIIIAINLLYANFSPNFASYLQ